MIAWLCFVLTIVLYAASRRLHRRYPRAWLSPVILVPVVLISGLLLAHISYAQYAVLSHWLVWLLGPATVAFAVPIYDQRDTIRRHWLPLVVGVVVGMSVAMASSLALARFFDLPAVVARSLAVRSISTPFALVAAPAIGGRADLAAVFVVLTGVAGMMLGQLLLAVLPLRSTLARGALFGVGAHAVGTATARARDHEEGVIASLTMIVAGILMVFATPLLAPLIQALGIAAQ